ncbi:MAG: winged helix-turn-helix domain-containing protein [Candidatus Asgardarchaeia archaeon]
MNLAFIERVVGGVEARKLILRRLLKGGASGIELKEDIEKSLGAISDTVVYYNLNRLVEEKLVRVSRRWREKIYELEPKWIPAIRKFFGIKAPVAYIGGFESEIPFSMRGRLRSFLGEDIAWFILIVSESMRGRVRLYGAECIYIDDGIWDGSVIEVMPKLKHTIEEKLYSFDLVVDITHGSEPTKIALLQLAYEYSLPCFRYEKGHYVWIKQ